METVFIKLLNMSISASWLILAVVIIRLFLKKAPKWSVCLLWGFVALKLIVPFSFKSIFSLIPSDEVIPETIATEAHPHITSGIIYVDTAVNPVMEAHLAPQVGDSANPMQVLIFIASLVWCIGMVICLIYAMTSFIILKRKVRASKKISDKIYACDDVKSPFILGILRPVIYIPSGMNKDTLDYVIAHENAHLKRGDHFWKPLGFLTLSVYWFNPLCWLAYILLCRDIEFACDEKVIRDKDNAYVNSYSQALLDCNAHRRVIAACPLAFGETGVKERIKGVLNYKKPALWIIIATVCICIVIAVCFLTNPGDKGMDIEDVDVNMAGFDVEDGASSVSVGEVKNLPIPPQLKIIYAGNECISTRGTYSWSYENSDGTMTAIAADCAHPLFMMDSMSRFLRTDDTSVVTLDFEEEPDEVYVRCWKSMYAEDENSYEANYEELQYLKDSGELRIPEEPDLIFEVVGSWKNGMAHYCFCIVSGMHLKNRDEDSVGFNTDEPFEVLSATALPVYKNNDYFISSCELSATQVTYVVTFDTPVYGDRIVEIYFRKADGELITLQQLAGNWTEIKFLSEGDPAQNTYRYTQSLADTINPLSVSGVVMNGVEYSFMNDDYYTGVNIPDTLRPFLSPFAERNDTFYVYAYDACEKMGAVIENDGRSYKICYRGNTLELSINEPIVYLNGNEKQTGSSAILDGAELLIPKTYMDCLGVRIMMYYPERGPVHPPKEWLITP